MLGLADQTNILEATETIPSPCDVAECPFIEVSNLKRFEAHMTLWVRKRLGTIPSGQEVHGALTHVIAEAGWNSFFTNTSETLKQSADRIQPCWLLT